MGETPSSFKRSETVSILNGWIYSLTYMETYSSFGGDCLASNLEHNDSDIKYFL